MATKGFTLAEVLLALLLISVAILTLLALSLQTLSASRKNVDTMGGQLVAEQVLEKLANVAEITPESPLWYASDPLTPYRNDILTQGDTAYNVSIYISDVAGFPPTPGQRLKLLQADVVWQDQPQGKARQGTLRISTSRLLREP